MKLFFDSGSKRVVKRIEFKETSFSQVPTAETLRILGITAEFLGELNSTPAVESLLPEGLLPGFPQSTYDEFARARPGRVRDGYYKKGDAYRRTRSGVCDLRKQSLVRQDLL